MKIQDVNNEGETIRQITERMKVQDGKTPPPSTVGSPDSGADRVDLSPQSREMKKIHEILATTPELRTERVAELKKAVDDGTYQVRSDDVAEKMVQEMALCLNRSSSL